MAVETLGVSVYIVIYGEWTTDEVQTRIRTHGTKGVSHGGDQ